MQSFQISVRENVIDSGLSKMDLFEKFDESNETIKRR